MKFYHFHPFHAILNLFVIFVTLADHQPASAKRPKDMFSLPSQKERGDNSLVAFIILSLGSRRGSINIKETGNESQRGITTQKRVNTPHVV